MRKILLTGAYSCTSKEIDKLCALGCKIDFIQQEADVITTPEAYDAVICNNLFAYHDIRMFSNLEYIQLTSAGYDRVPMHYINEKGIIIKNARGVYSIPIAEHVVMFALELMRNGKFFYENQKNRIWKKCRNLIELHNKTAVIIGCGSIGMEIAKRFCAFNVKNIGIDTCPIASAFLTECRDISQLYNVVQQADIVVSAIPYTEETHHIFDSSFFQHMNENAIFINVSRGGLVDEEALVAALKTRRIRGAALDVFENEPLSIDDDIWDVENLIITPHNSFVGDGNSQRLFDVIYGNLQEWMSLQ